MLNGVTADHLRLKPNILIMSGFLVLLYMSKFLYVCYIHIGGKHKGSFSAYIEDRSKTYFSIPDGEWFTYLSHQTRGCVNIYSWLAEGLGTR